MFARLKNRVLKFVELFSDRSNSIEITRRIYLLFFISIIGILNLIPLGILAKLQNNNVLFVIDFIVAIILVLNLVHVIYNKRFIVNIYIGIIVIACLYIFLYQTGGVGKSAFVWYFTFPLVVSYLLGSKKGLIAAFLLLIPVLFSTLFPLPEPEFVRYSVNFVVRFVFSYIVVLLFSYLFERSREGTRDQLAGIQNDLEDRVKLRTKELSDINKALKIEVRERKRVENALRISEKNYRLITESTSDLIAITSFGLNPIYKYVSPSHIQLGYKQTDLIGRAGFDLIHPADKKRLLPLLKKYAASKIKKIIRSTETEFGMTLEYRVYDKSGNIEFLQSTVNIIDKELLFVSKRITDQKNAEKENRRLQEKLIYSEKMESLGQLAGGVAHDLNNVLGGIVGYPDLILRKIPEDSDIRGIVEAIKRSGEIAAAMIGDLLSLVQRRVIVTKQIELNKIVMEYFRSPEFKKLESFHKAVNFVTKLDSDLARIEGSDIHLMKALMNLVSNAAEAMTEGGDLTVSTLNRVVSSSKQGFLKDITPGKYVVLNVTDVGVGITPGTIKKIFEPFYTKKNLKRSGTGLGMSVVLGTVIDHNGDIIVRSSKKKGSSFDVYFPAIKGDSSDHVKVEKKADYSGNGELILVVDDNAEQRDLLELLLDSLGYKVALVPSGEAALKYIKKRIPDVVILDMIMNPGIDGLETYLEMRNIEPNIKVILSSGYSDKGRIKRAFLSGVKQYIQKPFTIEEIGRAVSSELRDNNDNSG